MPLRKIYVSEHSQLVLPSDLRVTASQLVPPIGTFKYQLGTYAGRTESGDLPILEIFQLVAQLEFSNWSTDET